MGRPRKRWEDDVYPLVKPEETEETKGNDLKNNDTWIWAAKDQQNGKNWQKIVCAKIRENLTVTTATANAANSVAGKSNVANTFQMTRTKPVYDVCLVGDMPVYDVSSVGEKKKKKDKFCRNDVWSGKNKAT